MVGGKTVIELEQGTGGHRGFYSAEQEFNGTSDPILLRAFHNNVSVSITPATGTANVEFTTSPYTEIVAETADWEIWPMGDVVATASDTLLGTVTAVRGQSTDDCKIKVLAK